MDSFVSLNLAKGFYVLYKCMLFFFLLVWSRGWVRWGGGGGEGVDVEVEMPGDH